ncbi:MAG: hypothetical protein ACE14L_04740 [Terriglobales bacterium]
MSIRLQEQIGCIVAAAGVVWTVWVMTTNFSSTRLLSFPPLGPLELCGVGVIIWLTAKWRRSVKIK